MFSITDINPYLLLVAFICIIIVGVGPYVRRQLQWWIAFSKLPGPTYIQQTTFLWKTLFKNSAATFQSFLGPYFKKYPLIGLGAGSGTSFVLLCKAEALKVILNSKTQLGKASLYKYTRVIIGDGLATSEGAKWHQRRRLLTPSFHVEMLENYLVVMNEKADILVHSLEEKSKEANSTAFNICPYISSCAMDIICETMMGPGLNSKCKNNNEYFKSIEIAQESWMRRFFVPWLWFDKIYQFTQMSKHERMAVEMANDFPNQIVKNKLKQFAETKIANGPEQQLSEDVIGKRRRLAMLDTLTEMSVTDKSSGSKPLTEEDLRDEVKTFMFAGSDTSYGSICWAVYHIGRNPDVQQKIVDELNLVYGDCDRNSSSDDLNQLKYLECVIKETLRLNPLGPVIGRRLTEEMNICGYTIPADTDVLLSIFLAHRDPDHYPDPESFDPDRFLPENSQDRDPFAFVPFAAGLRNCIGQKFAMLEMKVVLSAITRRFKVKALPRDEASNSAGFFIGNTFDGVWVQLEKRKT